MAEGARLESVYTATYRGFESLPHRHIQNPSRNAGVFSFWNRIKGQAKPLLYSKGFDAMYFIFSPLDE